MPRINLTNPEYPNGRLNMKGSLSRDYQQKALPSSSWWKKWPYDLVNFARKTKARANGLKLSRNDYQLIIDKEPSYGRVSKENEYSTFLYTNTENQLCYQIYNGVNDEKEKETKTPEAIQQAYNDYKKAEAKLADTEENTLVYIKRKKENDDAYAALKHLLYEANILRESVIETVPFDPTKEGDNFEDFSDQWPLAMVYLFTAFLYFAAFVKALCLEANSIYTLIIGTGLLLFRLIGTSTFETKKAQNLNFNKLGKMTLNLLAVTFGAIGIALYYTTAFTIGLPFILLAISASRLFTHIAHLRNHNRILNSVPEYRIKKACPSEDTESNITTEETLAEKTLAFSITKEKIDIFGEAKEVDIIQYSVRPRYGVCYPNSEAKLDFENLRTHTLYFQKDTVPSDDTKYIFHIKLSNERIICGNLKELFENYHEIQTARERNLSSILSDSFNPYLIIQKKIRECEPLDMTEVDIINKLLLHKFSEKYTQLKAPITVKIQPQDLGLEETQYQEGFYGELVNKISHLDEKESRYENFSRRFLNQPSTKRFSWEEAELLRTAAAQNGHPYMLSVEEEERFKTQRTKRMLQISGASTVFIGSALASAGIIPVSGGVATLGGGIILGVGIFNAAVTLWSFSREFGRFKTHYRKKWLFGLDSVGALHKVTNRFDELAQETLEEKIRGYLKDINANTINIDPQKKSYFSSIDQSSNPQEKKQQLYRKLNINPSTESNTTEIAGKNITFGSPKSRAYYHNGGFLNDIELIFNPNAPEPDSLKGYYDRNYQGSAEEEKRFWKSIDECNKPNSKMKSTIKDIIILIIQEAIVSPERNEQEKFFLTQQLNKLQPETKQQLSNEDNNQQTPPILMDTESRNTLGAFTDSLTSLSSLSKNTSYETISQIDQDRIKENDPALKKLKTSIFIEHANLKKQIHYHKLLTRKRVDKQATTLIYLITQIQEKRLDIAEKIEKFNAKKKNNGYLSEFFYQRDMRIYERKDQYLQILLLLLHGEKIDVADFKKIFPENNSLPKTIYTIHELKNYLFHTKTYFIKTDIFLSTQKISNTEALHRACLRYFELYPESQQAKSKETTEALEKIPELIKAAFSVNTHHEVTRKLSSESFGINTTGNSDKIPETDHRERSPSSVSFVSNQGDPVNSIPQHTTVNTTDIDSNRVCI